MSAWMGNGYEHWAEELLQRRFETLLVDEPVPHVLRVTLNRPEASNAFTTHSAHELYAVFAPLEIERTRFRCVVLTGAGDKAFCTGGNTREYAEEYAGRPGDYRQYMRLFNDTVTGILMCDKPVINRVNGLRVGGGQEIGMACDFSVAQDLARFGQAGPKHGSAPIGGATDFLPLMVGAERAMAACVLCEPFSAHEAYHMGTFPDDYLRWRLVTGSPAEVVERLAAFVDAGCTLPILRFASWDPMGQMRRAMATVLPALRDHAARLRAPAA